MGAKKEYKTEQVHVRIDSNLMASIRALLVNPYTGKLGYGALTELIERQLRLWLEEQRDNGLQFLTDQAKEEKEENE